MSARAMIGTVPVLLIVIAAPGRMQAQEPGASAAPKPSASKTEDSEGAASRAVNRLVGQLKRHPVRPRSAPDKFAIYLMDVATGESTPIADEPAPGLSYCGSPDWSHDGRRILFDATPGTQWSLTRLESIESGPDRPAVTDLGAGNCPTFSPADDRIAFLSNADGAKNGIWLMKADGSGRRLLGDYGIPKWSPDGRQLMIVSFGEPRNVTIMDADPNKSGALHIADHEFHSIPSWAGSGTIVAVIGSAAGDRVVLVNVSAPAQPRVKEVLWRRADGPDVTPTHPIDFAPNRLRIFVGARGQGMSMYAIQPGKGVPAKPMGKPGEHKLIVNLAPSPDGRYILYGAQGPG